MKKVVLFLVLGLLACGGPNSREPSVLLVIIDTMRADHLGCMGYHRNTTPTLDSLARAGTLFTACQSQSSWTLPAVATIFSGKTPREHMAGMHYDTFFGVAAELPWMPMIFRANGYSTAAFFNVIFLDADFGFHRGFDHFDCYSTLASETPPRTAGETVDAFLEWDEKKSEDEPFFAAVHLFDPHIPYDPPDPWNTLFTDPEYQGEYDNTWGDMDQLEAVNSGRDTIPPDGIANLVALYDGELAYTDFELKRMLDSLDARGGLENTILVVVGDHGEEFLEHGGIEHGRTLYQEVCHVPLIFAGPGVPSGVRSDITVGQIHILPTILDLAGIETEESSLFSEDFREEPVPASNVLWHDGNLASLVEGDDKIIWSVDDGITEQYDLSNDPDEQNSTTPDSALLAELEWYYGTPPLVRPPHVDLVATIQRELRNLGYIR